MFTQAAIKVSGPAHCQSWLSDQWEACIIHQSTNQRTGETREKNWQFRENWLALTHKFCQFVFVFGIVVFHRISVYPLKPNIEKNPILSQKDSCCQTYQREPNDMEFFHHDLMFLENLMRRIFDFLLSEAGDQPQPGVRGNFAETFLSWQLLTFQPSGWQKIEIKLRLYTILRLCKNKSKYCNNIWLRQTAWLHQKSIPALASARGMFGR